MAEQYVRMNGKTFLYRQKAPFVASGMSVRGGIEYDAEEDKLRCHECGEWFNGLGTHVYRMHGISVPAYKTKHGLRHKTALVGEKSRISRSQRMTAQIAANPERHRETMLRALALAWKSNNRGGQRRPQSERRNERRCCTAQLVHDVRELADRLGRTPTGAEIAEAGISRNSCCYAMNVKTVASVVSLANLAPRVGKVFQYSEILLVEILRDFWVAHLRLPENTDYRRGLLPSHGVFNRVFGSMKNAYQKAGLGLAYAARKASQGRYFSGAQSRRAR